MYIEYYNFKVYSLFLLLCLQNVLGTVEEKQGLYLLNS